MADQPRYHALRKIADGGSAEVFLAEQVGAAGFKRLVVLKRIRPGLWADDQFRQMLIEEAHLAMNLHHSNLVEVLDLGEAGDRYFMVLELVDGWTLAQVAKRGADAGLPLPPELSVYLAAEVCRALAYAHQRTQAGVPMGIVHRDVCPNNVLVSQHAEVKLADFGIAKARTRAPATGVGQIKGKPAFMSPEQAMGHALDARSDLFSVGTLLYTLLTGREPFPGPSDVELLNQVATCEFASPASVRPDLPKELVKLVMKAMSRKREGRFSSAQEMLSALEQVQRSALTPAGRSELEAYLRALAAKDGAIAITHQSAAPVKTGEPEWIELSDEHLLQSSQNNPATPAAPAFTQMGRPSRWSILVGALLVVAAVGWWAKLGLPPGLVELIEPRSVVDAGPSLVAVVGVLDAGAENPGRPERSPGAPFAALADAGAVPEADAGAAPTAGAPDAGTAAVVPPAPVAELAGVDAGRLRPEPISRSGTETLKVSARLSIGQKVGAPMVSVFIESEPSGAKVKVDKRVLGKTPVALRFKSGITYLLIFEAEGQSPLRQWLMLTEREGKLPKVTLRAPVE